MALRSSMWEYFIKLNHDKVKCNLCSAVLSFKSNSTSCLNRHFRLKHPTVRLSETQSNPIYISVGCAEATSTLSATVEKSFNLVPVRQAEEFSQEIPGPCTDSVVGKCAGSSDSTRPSKEEKGVKSVTKSPCLIYKNNVQEKEGDSSDGIREPVIRMLQATAELVKSHSQPAQEDRYSAFGNYIAHDLREMSVVGGNTFVRDTINEINKVLMHRWNMLEASTRSQLPTCASAAIQKTFEQDKDTL